VFEKESQVFKKSVAIVMFIYSVSLTVSFLAGAASMTEPLAFLKNGSAVTLQAESQKLNFKVVKSIEELDAILESNKGKKILLDFSADWCTACKEFEEVTFSDAGVIEKMDEFVLIRADVTENTDKQKALSKKYGVFGPPAIIFFDTDLNVKKSKTIVGFMEPEKFLAHLNTI